MEEYKPNSDKARMEAKQPEKKVEKVISGQASVKKGGEIKKLARIFIVKDVRSVLSYIWKDKMIPQMKDLFLMGLAMMIKGDSNIKSEGSSVSKVNYSSLSTGGPMRVVGGNARLPQYFDYDQLAYQSLEDAEKVLNNLNGILARYGVVTIADFYDMSGLNDNNWARNNKYGWSDLRGVDIVHTNDGYMIRLPRAIPLD